LKKQYSSILDEIGNIYSEIEATSEFSLILSYFKRSSSLLLTAYTIYEGSIEMQKGDVDREYSYMNRNLDLTKRRISLTLKDFYAPSDKILFKNMIERASNLPLSQRLKVIDDLFENGEIDNQIDMFLEEIYSNSNLSDEEFVMDLFGKTPEEIKAVDDPFIKLAIDLYPLYEKQKEINKTRKGALDQLYAKLIDVKKEFMGADFVPDANSTLRLTYGNIRGYSPRDAVYSYPITTLNGVVEKTTKEFPFDSPDRLIQLHKQQKFGQYKHPKLGSVPVGILYNMDTTGGNSGSAVLNAKGELVGINFDRAYEATINDFAWSEEYSRSIAVDIRYVLWVLDVYSGANDLLVEMGVK
jgi:hypothetical protein